VEGAIEKLLGGAPFDLICLEESPPTGPNGSARKGGGILSIFIDIQDDLT